MLDYLNISEYPTALDAISSMLCNILRIEEKNWKSKFKEILLSNSEDLEKNFFLISTQIILTKFKIS